MVKRLCVAVLFFVCVSPPLGAELKYTLHLEMKKLDSSAPPANPMLGMLGEAVGQQLLPNGATDVVYLIGEKGTRTEFTKAAMGQPEGTVTLALPDGTMAVMNPKEQTYWKTTMDAASSALQAAGFKPTASSKRTGEFATVASVRCERVMVDLKMDLPIPETMRASLPPGFPTTLLMDGESCVTTDQFQRYAELSAKNKVVDLLTALGLDQLAQGGIVLRQTLRLSNVELESVVTAIAEEEAPAALFTIPAEYKEVPSPMGIK